MQNLISKMKRDMKELEDQAAASARSAQAEKEHSLQLERDLKVLSAQLEQVKKESAHAKSIAQKAPNDLKAVFDTCRKGIGAMCQHIFGKFVLFAYSLFAPFWIAFKLMMNDLLSAGTDSPKFMYLMQGWKKR